MDQYNYILENLNNLGELDRHNFKYLSEHVEQFYDNFSEKEISYIRYLCKLVSNDDFPNLFNRNKICIKILEGKLQFINYFNQRCYEDNGILYITPILSEIDAEEFQHISINIRKKGGFNQKWKQKLYSVNKYQSYNNYSFNNCCTASIYDNEIINIFKCIDEIKIEDLIQNAIELGGKKVECYSDDFRMYVNLGFMPISICKWDDRLASKKWLEINDMLDKNKNIIPELINNPNYILNAPRLDKIFFIYVGTSINISYNEWLQKVEYSENYAEAKAKRDNIYNKLMEGN